MTNTIKNFILITTLFFSSISFAAAPTQPLNDTGITQFGDGNSNALTTEPADYPNQDASQGRDALAAQGKLKKIGSGGAGFDFTKISSTGAKLAANVSSWDCVQDNVTGLMWEVKTTDGGLHDQKWLYTWYNSDSTTNGGNAGTANGGSCVDKTNCDTEKFAAAVNKAKLCGFSDWRLPTKEELRSIVDYSKSGIAPPTIDSDYFPNTRTDVWFWSASVNADSTNYAWIVNFSNGLGYGGYENDNNAVRLVRGGQAF